MTTMTVNEVKETIAQKPSQSGRTIGSTNFDKPGQRYATPSPGNGDRVFYETLLEQRPECEMAQEWCVYYGVLEDTRAHELHQQILKRRNIQSSQSPLRNKQAQISASFASKSNSTSSSKSRPLPNLSGGYNRSDDAGKAGVKRKSRTIDSYDSD